MTVRSSTGSAVRVVFFADNEATYFEEEAVEFTWHMGMSWQVRQRSVQSLHEAILKKYPTKSVLEASTKSTNYDLGKSLSAFNLTLDTVPVENIFQSSKVFNDGGPYSDILQMSPRDSKRDSRLLTSKEYKDRKLTNFQYESVKFTREPKSLFYDYIYIKALVQHHDISQRVLDYAVFTDIEFNQKVPYSDRIGPFNCQARALAIYVSLVRKGELEAYLNDPLLFTDKVYPNASKQTSLLEP